MKSTALIALCLLAIGSQLPAQTARDSQLPDAFAGKQLLWERQLGTHQYSIPRIDGDRIYLGTNDWGLEHPVVESTGGGLLHCLDRKTGDTIWQMPIPRYMQGTQAPYHFNHFKCGLCTQPMVEGDRIYMVGTRGEILCLDRDGQADGNDGPFTDELSYMNVPDDSEYQLQPTDGDIVWRYNLLTELDVFPHDVCGSNVLIDGDYLYACTSNGKDDRHNLIANPDAPSLIVLNKKTGKLLATDGQLFGSRLMHGNWSSPVMAEVDGVRRVLFGGGDGFMYAFEPYEPSDANVVSQASDSGAGPNVATLKVAWRVECNRPEYRHREDGTPIIYTPVGRKTYEGPSELISRPVIYKGRVYAPIGQSPNHGPGPGQLSCIDIVTGNVVWQTPAVDRSILDVVIDGGLLYLPDYTGTMHCIDPGDRRACLAL